MDLRFTPEENGFRQEVQSFIRDNLPADLHAKLVDGKHFSRQELVDWTRTLNSKGWGAPHWPVAYGGQPWTPVQQYIYLEEIQSYPAPAPLAFGVNMVGPVIYTFATEEQKQHYLPRILKHGRLVVPGLLGARLRLRPCLAEDEGRA